MKHNLMFSIIILLAIVQFGFTATIKGKVIDTKGNPVPLSVVTVENMGIQMLSGDKGQFEFASLKPGKYFITAYKDSLFDSLTVVLKDLQEITFVLNKKLKDIKQIEDDEEFPDKVRETKRKKIESLMKKSHAGSMTTMEEGSGKGKEREVSADETMEAMPEAPPALKMPSKPHSSRKSAPSESGLKAGYADDNQQFNYYVHFLEKFKSTPHFEFPVSKRFRIQVMDKNHHPVNNATVKIYSEEKEIDQLKTYADGSLFVYPDEYNLEKSELRLRIETDFSKKDVNIDLNGPRKITINLDKSRQIYQSIPLDLMFVLDVTGSMGEEIQRLKNTIEIINQNLLLMTPKPDIRFGLVLYRDRGDEFVTRTIPFSSDLQFFQQALATAEASGGGDGPEDLQSAMQAAVTQLDWREDAIRLGYIITDAPPHLDYNQQFTYLDACKTARQNGIKFFSVGTGGLNIDGEIVLRQIAQLTYGKYIFLTYGERGESEGGKPGSVSHHTGANFQTDKLESIIIRFTKDELLYQSDKPITLAESYFNAVKIDDETREETLNNLFNQALQELIDFSTYPLQSDMKLAVISVTTNQPEITQSAEYFGQQLLLTVRKNEHFKLVERNDLQKILEELKLQLTGLIKEEDAARMGELMGADLILFGDLYKVNGNYELFLKLVRVETAEVLSVTKAKLDIQLGI
ncbi:MAG: hypothetical protein Kow00108_17950 [Calditrichia bacterium]